MRVAVCFVALAAVPLVPCHAGDNPELQELPSLYAWNATEESPLDLNLHDALFSLPDTGAITGLTSRGFTGRLPGPTLRMRPGGTLNVNVNNQLDPEQNVLCQDLVTPETTNPSFCDATTMNMHTHGLHVSSRGVGQGMKFPSDDIFQIVKPQTAQQYAFAIPEDHAPGTHWYHSHWHHSTALGAGGGAAGALIVEDPPGYLPEEFASMPEHVLMLLNFQYENLQSYARQSQSQLLENAVSSATEAGLPSTSVFLVNGQVGPELEVQGNTWNRLRMVYAAISDALDLQFKSDDGAVCQMKLLAKDGIYVTDFPRDLPLNVAHLVPGARSDIIISCTCTQSYPCNAILSSQPEADSSPDEVVSSSSKPKGEKKKPKGKKKKRLFGFKKNRRKKKGEKLVKEGISVDENGNLLAADVDLMVLKVTTGPEEVAVLSSPTLPRPCYLVDMRNVPLDQPATEISMTFQSDPAPGFVPGLVITWNGEGESLSFLNIKHQRQLTPGQYNDTDGVPPLGNISVGGVHEFIVGGSGFHVFHVHVNPYQITKFPEGFDNAYYKEGDFQDTLMIPGITGNPTVRVQTDRFTGHIVVHCHLLQHEDSGMIAHFDIEGEEGTEWPGAKDILPTCYNTKWTNPALVAKGAQRLRRHHVIRDA